MSTPKRALARKNQNQLQASRPDDKKRTTLMISEEIDVAVEVCAARERKQKSQVVNEVLKEAMRRRGYLG